MTSISRNVDREKVLCLGAVRLPGHGGAGRSAERVCTCLLSASRCQHDPTLARCEMLGQVRARGKENVNSKEGKAK